MLQPEEIRVYYSLNHAIASLKFPVDKPMPLKFCIALTRISQALNFNFCLDGNLEYWLVGIHIEI